MYSWYSTNFRNPEQVEWSPDLYRWKPRRERWRRVRSGPWYYAITSSYGYYQAYGDTAWHNSETYFGIYFHKWSGLRRGYYRVKNFMWWDAVGRMHRQRSGYCSVR
jgi:hypothetical protein